MKILGIESAALTASAAVVSEDLLIGEYTVNFKKTHSQTLLPMIEALTRLLELDLHEIDAIAVSAGPGSFTGLRIGAATAKGLGLALQKPLVAVPTLEALAYQLWGSDGLICPIMDARRNQVYTGIYRMTDRTQTLMEASALELAVLIDRLNELGEKVIFTGDGIPVYRDILRKGLTIPCAFAPAGKNMHSAACVAALGLQAYAEGKGMDAAAFEPEYLRKSQAEREREEKAEG